MSSIADLLAAHAPTSTPYSPAGAFVTGLVTENNDKKFPYMVKVEFTGWKNGANISQWMPVLTGYAGKEHGCHLLPEVGDLVLVGFLGTMLDKPFVLGSFYPADSALPGEQFDEKNLNRHIKTKGGVTLTVRDEDGKQSVTGQTPKGLTFVAEDENETVTISDKDKKNMIQLDCKGGVIKITADSSIEIVAGKCEIKLDGKGGAVDIKCDRLNIEAGQTAKVAGKNMMTVEGGMLKLEGKQQAALKGGAMTEVSGGMLKLN